MSAVLKLDPLIYEFETQEQLTAYDKWFIDKVNQSIKDTRPNMAHDEAMAFVQQELERRKAERVKR